MIMFENIGYKIKSVAIAYMLVGMGLSIAGGALFIETNQQLFGVVTGYAIIVIGAITSWATAVIIYGFGELIERVQMISSR